MTGPPYNDDVHDGHRWWPVRVGVVLLAPVVVAVALVPLRAHVLNTNLALVLVVAILGVAVAGGRVAGVVGALSAALSYDFFLTVPYGSFTMERGDDIETTVLLAVVGLMSFGLGASVDVKHAVVALADQVGMALLRYRRP